MTEGFGLRVVVPDPPAQPPGQALPPGGASASVDRFANPDDAWSVRLRAGPTYRINTVTPGAGCAQVTLYAPGTPNFATPVRVLGCDRHLVFTPDADGVYTLLVRAPRASRSRLPYRLRVGVAAADDTAPGLPLADDTPVRGSLQGSELDALDLYRFEIEQRADLRVRVRTSASLQLVLLDEKGNRLASGSGELTRRVRPGRFFVAVRAVDGADGSYRLTRIARTITRARTLVDEGSTAVIAPGGSVALALQRLGGLRDRPVGVLPGRDVGDEQRERRRPLVRAAPDLVEQQRG